MKLLFIGGNGNISWYCVQKAIERGHEVWEMNRGVTLQTRRGIQTEVHRMIGDIRCRKEADALFKDAFFDVVCDFICFNEQQALRDIELFNGKTRHFMFISSDAVYRRKCQSIPFCEQCEMNLPEESSDYVAGKIMAERAFQKAYEQEGFPVTIIRPAYTYDVIVPVSIGHNCFTAPQKYLDGYPALIAGDGINLYTFTHSADFAEAFIGLTENQDTIGEAFNIAGDEWLTWNDEIEILQSALGIRERHVIHIPYEEASGINSFHPKDLMLQRMWHSIYNTQKVKEFVTGWRAKITFEEGILQTLNWLNEKPVRRRIVPKYENALMELYDKYMGIKKI